MYNLLKVNDVLQNWVAQNGVRQTSTVLKVRALLETLKVELEATLAKSKSLSEK